MNFESKLGQMIPKLVVLGSWSFFYLFSDITASQQISDVGMTTKFGS